MPYRWFTLCSIALLLGPGPALAETGSMGASVITPLTLSEAAPLEFGLLNSSDSGGTVVVDNADGRSATGGATLDGGAVQSGTWSVQGEPDTAYSIALPDSDVTLVSGGDSMTVNNFTDSEGGSSATDASGGDSFTVGATLNVGADQMDGAYSGSYEITVAYQ